MTRFLIDENVNQKAVRPIPAAQKGFDMLYPEQGFKGLKDTPVREIAIRDDRVLVTCDRDFAKYQLSPGQFPKGVLWIRPGKLSQKRIGELVARFCEFTLRTFPDNPYNFDQKIIEISEGGVEIRSPSRIETHPFSSD